MRSKVKGFVGYISDFWGKTGNCFSSFLELEAHQSHEVKTQMKHYSYKRLGTVIFA
jgi:hypothetical protein